MTGQQAMQPRRETMMIAGIVTGLRVQSSRRGKMAFVTLDDGGGSAEIVVFNEQQPVEGSRWAWFSERCCGWLGGGHAR